MERMLTSEEVAELLRVDVATVQRMVESGRLIAYNVGDDYRFIQADVETFVRHQRVPASSRSSGSDTTTEKPQSAKFTERARKVLNFAAEEATALHHNHVGVEHLLLGILREGEGVGAKVLNHVGITLESARQNVMEILGWGDSPEPSVGLTPRAKGVIEHAVEEAQQRGQHYVGTEHLLLGLLREEQGTAAFVFERHGIRRESIEVQVAQVLSHTQTTRKDLRQVPGPSSPASPIEPVPPEAFSLLPEGETSKVCSRCGAHSPTYFRYCFNCGQKIQ